MISRSISSDGAEIVYYICGSGERKLLLLHGNGEDHTVFDCLCRDLSGNFTIITPDSRGHGVSERGPERLSVGAMVRDAELIMRKEAPEGADVIGFSDGGNILLGLLARGLSKIDRAVLIGANMRPDGLLTRVRIHDALCFIGSALLSGFSKKARKGCELLGLMIFEPNFIAEDFIAVDCPVLVLAGENDMIKEKHTREIAAAFKNSQLCIIKNADHFLLKSAYKDIFQRLKDFLR